jgi:hypothetical protein
VWSTGSSTALSAREPSGEGRRERRRSSSSDAFVAMRYAQVENEARPSKLSMLRAILISAS